MCKHTRGDATMLFEFAFPQDLRVNLVASEWGSRLTGER